MKIDLFNTPIYIQDFSEKEINCFHKELSIVYNDLVAKNLFSRREDWDSHTSLLSYGGDFNINIFEMYDMPTFLSGIFTHLKKYMELVKFQSNQDHVTLKVDGSWMVLQKKNMYTHYHTHRISDISGVYYFQTNGSDGNILFDNPNLAITNSSVFSYYMNDFSVDPKIGRLILFPGFLGHRVLENKTNNDRVSISFNFSINKNQ